MSCFGQTLQRFTFEMSTREAQVENNDAEELDPSYCLIVKKFKTDIKLKKHRKRFDPLGDRSSSGMQMRHTSLRMIRTAFHLLAV